MNAPSSIPQLLVDKRGVPSGVRAGRAAFYTDWEEPPVCEYEGTNDTAPVPGCPVDSSAQSLLDVREGAFLDPGDVWLVGVQEVRSDLCGVVLVYFYMRIHEPFPFLLSLKAQGSCLGFVSRSMYWLTKFPTDKPVLHPTRELWQPVLTI